MGKAVLLILERHSEVFLDEVAGYGERSESDEENRCDIWDNTQCRHTQQCGANQTLQSSGNMLELEREREMVDRKKEKKKTQKVYTLITVSFYCSVEISGCNKVIETHLSNSCSTQNRSNLIIACHFRCDWVPAGKRISFCQCEFVKRHYRL